MSVYERFKHLKGRAKEKARRLFGKSPAQSIHAVSDVSLSSPGAPPMSTSALAIPPPQAAVSGPSYARPPAVQPPNTKTTRSGREAFNTFLTSIQFGPLKEVADIFTDLFETYEGYETAHDDYAALQQELQGLLTTLDKSFPGDVSPIITEFINDLRGSIGKGLKDISSRDEEGAGRRLLQAQDALDKVKKCRDQIRDRVDAATLRMVGEHEKRLDKQEKIGEEQKRIVEEQAIDSRLKALNPSFAACYKSSEAATLLRRECTPKTRKEVLSALDRWRNDANQGNIFWMNGMAGTGKTTIANTLCATLEKEKKLGASFFCTRQLPKCRSVKLILPTIAYQLARFSRPFRDSLSRALESDPDLRTKDLPTQLQGLIIGPLSKISKPLPTDLVIVIDALDECEDRDRVGQILELLVNHASDLPLKVFVSSRPEANIRTNVGSVKSQLVLHELDNKIVKDDIEIYLRAELAGTSVSKSQLSQLVERAGVLFIYAATAIRYIKVTKFRFSQQERVNTVLDASSTPSSNKNKEIDALYSIVLASAFSNPDLRFEEADITRIQLVLHTVVCTQEPLTVDALTGLLKLESWELLLEALEPLWSVLHVSGFTGDSLVTTLHTSFSDYMFDAQRSNEYCCNATSHHGQLAELCFERIDRNERQFNICGLESSYLFDDQVRDLDERVKSAIPLDLSYACQYWAAHLELGGISSDRIQALENFLSKRLLLWMEVLNLTKRMNVGAVLLEKARKWCPNGGGSEALSTQGLIHDAWRFTTTFAANSVSRSTPHLYVSMLAFWPSSKLIDDCYVKRARRLVGVGGSGMARRQLALLGVFPVGSGVESVAFSPDGTRIICGCEDGTIRVWDAQSGKMVLGPLKGHTSGVSSVTCSPDGHHIASGSWDKTIRMWDARSGKTVLEALEGHTGWVRSVAFSPDSVQMVSGSDDATIRVWDVQTGEVVLGPLEGHTSRVYSVAFSPDGTNIVSGSGDKTIRVWNSKSGQVVLGPLEGHTRSAKSVAFSLDGTRIVSGSNDQTIQVWDAQTGKAILGPLKGCPDRVTTVAYSPDGVHIVSGSEDKAIQVWDTRSGQVVLGPLEGHTAKVTSVAFSPNGMRVVSGSSDATIRVWDVQIREVSLGPSDGHIHLVCSVAFAPNGMCIVSGSSDRTVRVWDAQSGKLLLTLVGHAEEVNSVACSPDSARIVSGSSDRTIRLWDSQTGKLALEPLEGHIDWVRSVTFSPDGAHVVSGSDDNTIRVWDSQSGKMVLGPLEGHTDWVFAVAVSPDGRRIVSGSRDRTIRVWDVQNGKLVLGPLEGHTDWVRSVVFSPDGRRILSGSDDKTLRVWNAQNGGKLLEPLEGHTDEVYSVAFSPDGMYIVSGSRDKTIRVCSAQTGELVWDPLNGHISDVHSTSFSPDGTRIVSSSRDQAIRVWRLPCPPSIPNPGSLIVNTPSLSHSVTNSSTPHLGLSHQPPSDVTFPQPPNEDGWLVDEYQHLWLWVPPDLRNSIVMSNNTLVISRPGPVQLNFDGASMGKSWTNCYVPV